MSEIIRPYCESDRADIMKLWGAVFGDKEEYISFFLEKLPETGVGAVAECDGHAVSMAYALTGLSYEGQSVGYIYAVASDEKYRGRGYGERVSRLAAELSGADIISTFPAEDSLYDWYEKILGTGSSLHICSKAVNAEENGETVRISYGEYNAEREKLLEKIPHVSLTEPCAELEEKLCATYGGGFFRCGDTIMAAYKDGKNCLVREALGREAENAAASLAAFTGAERAYIRIPSAEGERFAAIPAGAMDEKTVWNLCFD